jgi:hypothetical protein
MHETTKSNNESMTKRYRAHGSQGRNHLTFETGDLVWLHLHTNHSPNLKKSILMSLSNGHFKVLEKINDSAYKLELPITFGVVPCVPF